MSELWEISVAACSDWNSGNQCEYGDLIIATTNDNSIFRSSEDKHWPAAVAVAAAAALLLFPSTALLQEPETHFSLFTDLQLQSTTAGVFYWFYLL